MYKKVITQACVFSFFSLLHGYSTIYVPSSVSYNPVYDQALRQSVVRSDDVEGHFISAQLYTQKSIGNSLDTNFLIQGNSFNSVNEFGYADICSEWFQTINEDGDTYRSILSMRPESFSFGGLLQAGVSFYEHFYLIANTTILQTQNAIHFQEDIMSHQGAVPEYNSITTSLQDEYRLYAKLSSGSLLKKTGVDDVQIRLLYKADFDSTIFTPYAMLGIPTGKGSQGVYLFEPLVGSKHVQLGLGANVYGSCFENQETQIYFVGEAKWYYGLQSEEVRSLDFTKNGQWSRFLLVVKEETPAHVEFAANYSTVPVQVTPGNHVHILAALKGTKDTVNFECGYKLFYRGQEKIALSSSVNLQNKNIGIADLLGIPNLNPVSASTATIAQGVRGANVMRSDAEFVALTNEDLNLVSAAQKTVVDHTLYAHVGCNVTAHKDTPVYLTLTGACQAAERSSDLHMFSLLFGMNVLF